MMKGMSVTLLLGGLLLSTSGLAASTQQEKMTSCNAQASAQALKGGQRKTFMSTCLKAAPATQQEKMTACNASAGAQALKGDERKQFMSECLRKK